MIGQRRIEQQNGVSRRGRIQNDEPVRSFGNRFREARKTAISSVQGDRRSSASKACPCTSRPCTGCLHHLGGIACRFSRRIDPADRQVRQCVARNRRGEVRGRIGGGKMDAKAAFGEPHSDRGGNGRLAHAPFAHRENDAVAWSGQTIDQRSQRSEAS